MINVLELIKLSSSSNVIKTKFKKLLTIKKLQVKDRNNESDEDNQEDL